MNDWNKGAYMRTFTGEKFYPSHPDKLNVRIEDIAHALSHMNRYCGHLKYFYSVAQHCLIVEEILSTDYALELGKMSEKIQKKYRLQALLHDASEAYMPDMPSPIKKILPDFKVLEKKLQAHIFKSFKLPKIEHSLVKEIDAGIRGSEVHCLSDWVEEWTEDKYYYNIIPMDSRLAEDRFLEKYRELTRT